MNPSSVRIVLCSTRKAPAFELLVLAEQILLDGRVVPVIVVGDSKLAKELRQNSGKSNLEIVSPKAPRASESGRTETGPSVPGIFLRRFLKSCLPRLVIDFLVTVRAYYAGRRIARTFFESLKPDALVIPDDRALGIEHGICSHARQNGVPVFCAPFAISDPASDLERRKGRQEFDATRGSLWIFNRIIERFHPGMYARQEASVLSFLTAGQLLALTCAGERYAVPWSLGGGWSDMVFAFNQVDRDQAVSAGVSPEKIIVTGQGSLDPVYQARSKRRNVRAAINREFGLVDSLSLTVLAMPQHAEHGMAGWQEHLDACASLVNTLSSLNTHLVISLHPRANPDIYRNMAHYAGAHIANRPLREILSAADLFVATHSSTVRWAVLQAIPTIVLDDHSLAGRLFPNVEGLCFVRDRALLRPVAERLLVDMAERNRRQAQLRRDASRLDLFDGHSTERIVTAMIEKMGPAQISASKKCLAPKACQDYF